MSETPKIKVATAWLGGCSGCHMSFLDLDERLLDLAKLVEFTASPITDVKEIPQVDVGIVEGAVCNDENEHVLRTMRRQCKVLIALGDCALTGNVPALRNQQKLADVLERGYVETESTQAGDVPSAAEVPKLTPQVRPIQEFVKVDAHIPGCPPDADAIWYAVTELLAGRNRNGHLPTCVMTEINTQTITINPVTRIEGHAKITIHLDDAGNVADTRFHVVEFRGFEKFCEGRFFAEMPQITARICGICPVSHLLASAKACDAILGVEIPRPAKLLRELLHMGQLTQSHALSFFHLSAPDLLLGFDSDPASRNIIGLIQQHPDIARRGIRLRKFGQEVIKSTGGRKIHPDFPVPGGVNKALTKAERDEMRAGLPEAMEHAHFALNLLKKYQQEHLAEIEEFACFDSNFMGLVQPDGALEHYDGKLRFCDPKGNSLEDQIDPAGYLDVIAETTEDWSYLKFPFIKSLGYPDGLYRVGPLARLNVVDRISTPQADRELQEWRSQGMPPRRSSFYYHWARLIEIVFALERIEQLLEDRDICSTDIMVNARPANEQGIGVIEAPRGTLFHHYWVDEGGRVEKVNLIVATGHNNLAMNRAVKAVADKYVKSRQLQEGMLNRVEAAIRCYDPCLSCSTHAVGQMPIRVDLVDADGQVLQSQARD